MRAVTGGAFFCHQPRGGKSTPASTKIGQSMEPHLECVRKKGHIAEVLVAEVDDCRAQGDQILSFVHHDLPAQQIKGLNSRGSFVEHGDSVMRGWGMCVQPAIYQHRDGYIRVSWEFDFVMWYNAWIERIHSLSCVWRKASHRARITWYTRNAPAVTDDLLQTPLFDVSWENGKWRGFQDSDDNMYYNIFWQWSYEIKRRIQKTWIVSWAGMSSKWNKWAQLQVSGHKGLNAHTPKALRTNRTHYAGAGLERTRQFCL